MNVSAKTIIAMILAFIALAIGPITYVDYAKEVKLHHETHSYCNQRGDSFTPIGCSRHDKISQPPPLSNWIDKWAAAASPALLILALMYITPLLWRFFLDRLRDIARALRGMD